MNINASQLNMYRVQSNTSFAKAYQTQTAPETNQKTDQLSISSEGKAMRKAVQEMHHENGSEMKASMDAFSSAYKDLDIASLNTETMSDEEITTVLQQFEDALGELKPDHMRTSSEMTATERKDALKNLQSIGTDMQSGKSKPMGYGPLEGGGGGRPPMRPQGPPPTNNKVSSSANDSSNTLQTLLEAFSEDEEESTQTNAIYANKLFANTSIQDILSKLTLSTTT